MPRLCLLINCSLSHPWLLKVWMSNMVDCVSIPGLSILCVFCIILQGLGYKKRHMVFKKNTLLHLGFWSPMPILIGFLSKCALKQQTDLYVCALRGLGRSKSRIDEWRCEKRDCIPPTPHPPGRRQIRWGLLSRLTLAFTADTLIIFSQGC